MADAVDRKAPAQVPLYWTAQRLGTGERFACPIRPPGPLQAAILGHLELTEEHFADALPLDEARAAWEVFQRPSDILAVYNRSTARLLAQMSSRSAGCLVLKSLDELVAAEGLAIAPARTPGRAGKRLANAVALIRHLRVLKNCEVS